MFGGMANETGSNAWPDASMTAVNGAPVPATYGDSAAEYDRLRRSAALLDLTSRGRLCVLGRDRIRFLNGQVTNDVKALAPGGGCYAVLCSAKGKMEADLHIYRLEEELLLDLEPGLLANVQARLERFIIAEDVELMDASDAFGLLSVQGPKSGMVLGALGWNLALPSARYSIQPVQVPGWGELYVTNHPRLAGAGFEVYCPMAVLPALAETLWAQVQAVGGGLAGWHALETARIEDGIPRFGQDMDATNLPPEAGIEERAISYRKGCYIGQEVIARLRTYGQAARKLRGLRFAPEITDVPQKGDSLVLNGKPVGHVTSAVRSPALGEVIALGYVRREVDLRTDAVRLIAGGRAHGVRLVDRPLVKPEFWS